MSGDYSKYDQLLEQARGSAKYWIPKLCQALKEENSEMSNEDIRERVKKDCVSTWQRDTITDALPEEYKDKEKSGLGKRGRQKQLQRQDGGLVTEQEHGSSSPPDSNRAQPRSDSSNRQESQTFVKPEEVIGLRNEVKELKDKLKEKTGIIQKYESEKPKEIIKDLKVTDTMKREFSLLVNKYNHVIQQRIDKDDEGEGTFFFYVLSKRSGYYIPVDFTVNCEKKTVSLALNEERLDKMQGHS